MKKISLLLTTVFTVLTAMTFAQSDYPPGAEPGKCYAKCQIPDQYETITEEVLVQEASSRLEVVPAQYETVTEQILVKEASSRLEIIPAQYETITETIEVRPAGRRLVTVPAQYETVTETIEVAPATTKWVKTKGNQNCLSQNPDDCLVWCLVEQPARFETVTKQVVSVPATTQEVEIPAEFKTVTKTIVSQPASTREVEIPAEYATVTKTIESVPASTREVEIPAQYKTVTYRKLVQEGGFSEWREVLCSTAANYNYTIRQVQEALRSKGYDVGPAGADNVFGADTKAALIKFQKDNGLPVGNLNMETLRALGVQY